MKELASTVVQWLVIALALTGREAPAAASTTGERRLLARARDGDVRAFERLLAGQDRALRALAFRMLGSAAAMDDVLQDSYLRAYRGLADFAGDAAFGTWLHRIVANACLDELRRAARRPQVPLDEIAEQPAAGPRQADRADRRMDLAAALDTLEPELRIVVLMVDAQGFSYEEVGRAVGIPAGTVASRLHRARAALRPHLAPPSGGSST